MIECLKEIPDSVYYEDIFPLLKSKNWEERVVGHYLFATMRLDDLEFDLDLETELSIYSIIEEQIKTLVNYRNSIEKEIVEKNIDFRKIAFSIPKIKNEVKE